MCARDFLHDRRYWLDDFRLCLQPAAADGARGDDAGGIGAAERAGSSDAEGDFGWPASAAAANAASVGGEFQCAGGRVVSGSGAIAASAVRSAYQSGG